MAENNIEELIDLALKEDIGEADITTRALIADDVFASAEIVAKEELVVAGQDVVAGVFAHVDGSLVYTPTRGDGSRVEKEDRIALVQGGLSSILTAERTALNFLQRLCGIATRTAQIVKSAEKYQVKILDTRKTTPGHRELDKYAVSVGGGVNHRRGLFDAFLIKNNHLDALGGDVAEAVKRCREHAREGQKIEVEVRSLKELRDALRATPDAILLDNMSPKEIEEAVQVVRDYSSGKIELEASGGIDSDNIVQYLETGVDAISMGWLTHSVRAVDISLRYMEEDNAA